MATRQVRILRENTALTNLRDSFGQLERLLERLTTLGEGDRNVRPRGSRSPLPKRLRLLPLRTCRRRARIARELVAQEARVEGLVDRMITLIRNLASTEAGELNRDVSGTLVS